MSEIFKKLGFTDKYLIITSIVIGVFCFCCLAVFAFIGKDTVAYVISAVGLMGTVVGFVVNKNKNENVAKIQSWGNPNQPIVDLTNNTESEEGDA